MREEDDRSGLNVLGFWNLGSPWQPELRAQVEHRKEKQAWRSPRGHLAKAQLNPTLGVGVVCGQTRAKQAGWGQPGVLEEQDELGLAMPSVGQPGPGQH